MLQYSFQQRAPYLHAIIIVLYLHESNSGRLAQHFELYKIGSQKCDETLEVEVDSMKYIAITDYCTVSSCATQPTVSTIR